MLKENSSVISNVKINSSDDFSPLKSVVVGIADWAGLPNDLSEISARFNYYSDSSLDELKKFPSGGLSQQIIHEANEDANELVKILEKFDVTVYRPEERNFRNTIKSSEGWETEQFNGWSPRDHYLSAGETLIISASPTRSRQQEYLNMYDLALKCSDNGATLISCPIAPLRDTLYDASNPESFKLNESEIVFESANVLRVGKHYFYQISVSGNWRGFYWLKKILEREGIDLIPLEGIYNGVHIDSTIYIPKPGVVVMNRERINPNRLPEPLEKYFRSWIKLFPEVIEDPYASKNSLSSKWLGINAFSITPEYAIIDAKQTDLRRLLEKNGITPIPHTYRHSQLLGGGLHCSTFDLEREGVITDYFN